MHETICDLQETSVALAWRHSWSGVKMKRKRTNIDLFNLFWI